ncbi:MAG: NAD(P)/FAD-dependent oxidoreductase, partial [Bacteroidota bacterium]
HFQAFEHAVEEARKNEKIEFVMEAEPRAFNGNGHLQNMAIEHLPTGEKRELNVEGAFIFVGYLPNTESLQGLVDLNERNEIVADRDMKTNVPGVFAAGDSINKRYRQITTAAAEGTIAALSAGEYLR